jgi:Tfp pilus assembly protein PilF
MERIDQLKEFLVANPRDHFAQHALALEYVKRGEDAKARILFEEILTDDPGYIGSYYHLAKLFERTGELSLAINCYEKGMSAAKGAGDDHAYNELHAAYEELLY